jgi:hypothetical protein
VDTVATQNAAGETGTLHCSERTENSTAVSNPINLIPIDLDTAAISTAAGETSIGGYQHVVGDTKVFGQGPRRQRRGRNKHVHHVGKGPAWAAFEKGGGDKVEILVATKLE